MRTDIGLNLFHLTTAPTEREAYQRFKQIVAQRKIIGASGMVRGGHKCVCFTETPLDGMPRGLKNLTDYSLYSGFGIIFHRNAIFAKGGRPVIYQTENELSFLHPSVQWRHVKLDLASTPPIDFLWEREWRLKIDALDFDPSFAHLLFPNIAWANYFAYEYQLDQEAKVQSYSLVLGLEQAQAYYQPFPWYCHYLDQTIYPPPPPQTPLPPPPTT